MIVPGQSAVCSRLLLAGFVLMAPLSGVSAATDLSGRWVGRWESRSSGHSGPLSATFTRCGETEYRVTFRGRFLAIVPFRYSVVLDVVADDGDSVRLAGRSYLGRMFGTFAYEATADACRFDATYSSRKDEGAFRMTRRSD
ncbi:MAG: hypothetical protein EBZ59_03110 [Planctomycetia bacterium]|nr:hypothetical protein [Planctomycetia bacterium]